MCVYSGLVGIGFLPRGMRVGVGSSGSYCETGLRDVGMTYFDGCIRPTGGRRFEDVHEALRTGAGIGSNTQTRGCCHLMVNVTTNRGRTPP